MIIAFVVGLFAGAGLGVLLMCVLALAGDDNVEPKYLRDD